MTSPANASLDPGSRDVTGAYWCSIDEDGYDYPRYPCAIKKVGDKLVLAKLGGSQRFRGHIKLDDKDGFSFIGEVYCPDGDCNEELHGRFKPMGRGGFKGSFREETMVVHLVPAPADAFGGSEYAGDSYGGDPFAYGGQVYGGFGYGAHKPRIDMRGRRRP